MTRLTEAQQDPKAFFDDLKARQIAFFEARLVSPRAEAEWRENIASVYREFLASKIGSVIDARAVTDALDAVLSDDALRTAVRPLAKATLDATIAELRQNRARVGDHVPEGARGKLDALLDRPKLFPDRLARELVEQEAVEEVMRDVLYETLKEFSEKVNPFFADWGLPALLGRLSPFGLGGMKKGLESFRGEFDRRLEPEMRKFLQGFAKKGLRRMVELTIAKSDEPKSIAVRKRLAAWVLEQEIAVLARSMDDEGTQIAEELGLDLVTHALSMDAVRERRRALIEAALADRKEVTLRDALAEHGFTHTPDFDAIARATWPVVRAALAGPAVRSWIASLIGEFYEEAAKEAG